jgi:hypothetical protein
MVVCDEGCGEGGIEDILVGNNKGCDEGCDVRGFEEVGNDEG